MTEHEEHEKRNDIWSQRIAAVGNLSVAGLLAIVIIVQSYFENQDRHQLLKEIYELRIEANQLHEKRNEILKDYTEGMRRLFEIRQGKKDNGTNDLPAMLSKRMR